MIQGNISKKDDGLKRKHISYLLLFIIIVLTLGRIVYSFIYLKEDYHSDEMWSYGLSNSYFQPFIHMTADHETLTNHYEWLSSDVLKSYLTVDKTQRFAYDSVYFNQVHDYHPPFYYYVLHTICSFFPGKFSLWYGFAINLVAFVFTIVFFYKLLFELSKKDVVALVGCAFYGFSIGAVNNFVFIRMYSVVTMFSVILLYLHSRLLQNQKYLIPVFLITVLGALTHHFYIPFAGCIALCFCVYYLKNKQIKLLVIYALTMLSAVGVSLLLFPETIDHLFSGRINDAKYPFVWQFTMSWSCVLSGILGINLKNGSSFSYIAVLIVIACLVLIISPLFFLFRKEIWFKKSIEASKQFVNNLINKIKNTNVVIVSMLVSAFGIVLLTSLTVSLMNMGSNTDRYLFIIFPCVSASFVLFVSMITSSIKKYGRIIFSLICAVFCIMSNVFGTANYYFKKPDNAVSLQETITGANCVYICDLPWLMTCFTRVAMDSENFYASVSYDLEEIIREMPDPPENSKPLYYVVHSESFFKEKMNGVIDNNQFSVTTSKIDRSEKIKKEDFEDALRHRYNKCEYIGLDTMFEREYEIYRVK